jgi:cell wall assembly regulator SMI1
MNRSWARIESWLERYAPATFAALEPPADPADISAAEESIGMPFPEPLVESLHRHAGTGYRDLLPPFYWLCGPQEIARTWHMLTRINGVPAVDEETHDGDVGRWWQGPWWHRGWLPFAADGGGGQLVIDQRPVGGRPGWIGERDKVDGGQFGKHEMWSSLPVLFDRVATAMETGEVLDSYERTVTEEGELDWAFL